MALKEKQKTKEFANMVWVLQILKVVEDDKIDVKHIEHQGKDENVSITIENSPKIMLIDIENSWILTFKKKQFEKTNGNIGFMYTFDLGSDLMNS